MLDLLRRLFGFWRKGRGLPGFPAIVTIRGTGSAGPPSCPAWLELRDGGGTVLLSCQVEVGVGRNRFDDFPEGDYGPGDDPEGEAEPPGPVLRLQARVGENAPPPLHGRPSLLIHGNRAGPPADGAIRMDDAGLAQLLALLPDDPGQVLVQLFRPAEDDAETADADTTGSDPWPGGEERPGQAGTMPDPAPAPDAAGTAADQAAALALARLGFTVLSEQAAPATAAQDAAALAATEAATEAATGAATGAAADGDAAGAPDAASGWAPAGGEYGR